MKSLKEMKQKGRTLRKHLEAVFGREVTLMQAYEALAVSEGFENWNVLSARLTGTDVPVSAAAAKVTTSSEGPRVMALFMTLDGKAKCVFDATAWFEQASYGDIVDLMDEAPSEYPRDFPSAYGGRENGWALAEFFAGKDEGVDAVYAYIKALHKGGGDCGGSDCYVNGQQLDEWVGSRFDLRGQRIAEAKHNRAYGRLVMGLNGETAATAPSAMVRDVDLAKPENRDLARQVCARIWADCVEEWKKPRAMPCEYLIESSTIFGALSTFDVQDTDPEGGYHDDVERILDDLLEEFGYYAQARRLFKGEVGIDDPVRVEGEPTVKAEYTANGLYSVIQVVEVNLVDVLNEYDIPEEAMEWQWVEQHHRWKHKNNGGEPGVWEFMVYVDQYHPEFLDEVPAVLKPFFEEALRLKAPWIMFHQG